MSTATLIERLDAIDYSEEAIQLMLDLASPAAPEERKAVVLAAAARILTREAAEVEGRQAIDHANGIVQAGSDFTRLMLVLAPMDYAQGGLVS